MKKKKRPRAARTRPTRALKFISHDVSSISLRKSTPPQNRHFSVYYYLLKDFVDDFVEGVTF